MNTQSIQKMLPFKISVCGRAELELFRDDEVSHLLSIDSPGSPTPTPAWFKGIHRHLAFLDIEDRATARVFGVDPPTKEDVGAILSFGSECLQASGNGRVHLLIHCLAGVSRSPAAAYAIMCMLLEPGREKEIYEYLLEIRPCAYPNRLMLRYADELLKRNKAAIRATKR